jgi:hypothetical protein
VLAECRQGGAPDGTAGFCGGLAHVPVPSVRAFTPDALD